MPDAPALLNRYFTNSPLRHAPFRLFYLGAIGTALGLTLQATLAAWLMATLTTSALMVALVQTANTLPTLLFGLFAGTLADIVDRKRLIIIASAALVVVTSVLGLLEIAEVVGPISLLFATFLIGCAFTFYMPAQQASINGFVGREELAKALALGAVAFSVARAVGPALGGSMATWLGSGSALLLGAFFFSWMLIATRRWGNRERPLPGIPETLMSGAAVGLRYARHSPAIRALIVRNLCFTICASGFLALLPVIARDQLSMGAGGFGLLSGAFGIGAVTAALSVPRQLQRRSLAQVVQYGVMLWTVSLLLITWTNWTALAVLGAAGAGAAWMGILSSLSAGTQSSAPAWVRARAVAMNLVAVQASIAAGSAIWGTLAIATDTRVSLTVSACALVLLHLWSQRFHIEMGGEADVAAGPKYPDLAVHTNPMPDDGPVLIQIEYRIHPKSVNEFYHAIHQMEPIRRRNGATSWRVFRDLSGEGLFVERFILASWAEYVRLRTRMTIADRAVQARVEELQLPEVPVRVVRYLGLDAPE